MNIKNKRNLKQTLIITSGVLGSLWLLLLFFGIFFESYKEFNIAKEAGQIFDVKLSKNSDQPYNKPIDMQNNIAQSQEQALVNNTKQNDKQTTDKSPAAHDAAKGGKAKISIVITNLGTNKIITEHALELSNKFSLGFLPYTTTLKNKFDQAIKNGFEVYLYLPFEPQNYPDNDPGPFPILASAEPKKNIEIIKNMISSFPGIKGVYGSFRENLSHQQQAFDPILNYFSNENYNIFLGKNFIENKPIYLNKYKNIVNANIIIDLVPDSESIKQNLEQLVNYAKANNSAVGYVITYPVTLSILKEWLPTLEKLDVELVPLSAIN